MCFKTAPQISHARYEAQSNLTWISTRGWVILRTSAHGTAVVYLTTSNLVDVNRAPLGLKLELPVIAIFASTVTDRRFWITKIKIAILAAATFAALC